MDSITQCSYACGVDWMSPGSLSVIPSRNVRQLTTWQGKLPAITYHQSSLLRFKQAQGEYPTITVGSRPHILSASIFDHCDFRITSNFCYTHIATVLHQTVYMLQSKRTVNLQEYLGKAMRQSGLRQSMGLVQSNPRCTTGLRPTQFGQDNFTHQTNVDS